MTDILSHRGPDNRGFYREQGVGLGHRRLSILDLSASGAQPMHNEDGTVYVVCNGEIYNYLDKKEILEAKGHTFTSKSDSEVLVHLYEEYGDSFLPGLNGMFAFIIWDSRRKRLLAAVDKFGKKPLYYAVRGETLAMASELKSLLELPWVQTDINFGAVDRYLHFRYVPAPVTIYRSVGKFEQAQIMIWSNGKPEFRKYWQPHPNDTRPFDRKAVDEYADLLRDAIQIRLNSDVPLGLYLSSGVDSCTISAIMNTMVSGRKNSYTAAFEYEYNELEGARRIAEYLGLEFNPVRVEAGDFELLPIIARHLDEPFGDLIVLPQYRLAQKAKSQVSVVLTGDGADETLNGYMHQKVMDRWRSWSGLLGLSFVPEVISRLVQLVPASLLDRFFDYPDTFGPRERLKLTQTLALSGHFGTFYEGFTSCFTRQDKEQLYTDDFKRRVTAQPISEEFQKEIDKWEGFSFLSRLSLMDLKYWIPFIVIFRLDKLNMAHAVETRSPYLDYRLVEMSLSLEDEGKLNPRRSKEILRQVHERVVPQALQAKGKQAFYMPFLKEHRRRLRAWVDEMINQTAVAQRGYFNWKYIEGLYDAADRNSMLANRQLVALAMLEQWHRVFPAG